MAIPDYQSIFLIVLKAFENGQIKRVREIVSIVSDSCNLNKVERETRLPSGKESIIKNRTRWACFDLKRAGLLDQPKHGFYVLTQRGLEELQKNPSKIDNNYLMQFPEYQEARRRKKKKEDKEVHPEKSIERTPEEYIEEGIEEITQKVKSDLLDKLRSVDPRFFEEIVGTLLESMGYGQNRLTPQSGDGGIDGVVEQDALGLETILTQSKRYAENNTVPAKEIRDFVGAVDLGGRGVQKGVFFTTSKFPKNSKDIIANSTNNIVLIDGEKLVDLMLKYEVGVEVAQVHKVWKVDNDFFDED